MGKLLEPPSNARLKIGSDSQLRSEAAQLKPALPAAIVPAAPSRGEAGPDVPNTSGVPALDFPIPNCQ